MCVVVPFYVLSSVLSIVTLRLFLCSTWVSASCFNGALQIVSGRWKPNCYFLGLKFKKFELVDLLLLTLLCDAVI